MTARATVASAAIAFVSAVISLFVLAVAIWAIKYTQAQIEDSRKEAQAQHLIEKADEFNSPRYKEIRRALAEKRLDQAHNTLRKLDLNDTPVEMDDELAFCNHLGVLTRHGALSAYDVWAEFSDWLFPFYADAEAIIKDEQKGYPASWSNCDYLVVQVTDVEKREDNGKQLNPSEDAIRDFYFSELYENRRGKP